MIRYICLFVYQITPINMYQEYPIPAISSIGEGCNSTPGPLELWSLRAQNHLPQLLQAGKNCAFS